MSVEVRTRPFRERVGLTDLLRGIRYGKHRRRVRRLAAMTPEETEQFQIERLRDIVTHAYENVELYQRLWRRAGVRPQDIRTPADIEKLPIVTKEDFRQSFPDGILSREYSSRQCYIVGTSGSTGTPVRVFLDLDKALFDFSVNLPQIMAGRRPITVVSGAKDFLLRTNIRHLFIVVDEARAYESLQSRVFPSMKHAVVNSLLSPQEHIEAINRKRPELLMTYPSVLRNICMAVRASGTAVHQPDLIMAAGEVLDEPLRKLIGRTFSAELMNVYGSTEAGFLAAECPEHCGLHLLAWKVLVELLGDDGKEVAPGRTGRVVVTDLFNRATPIIRYAGLGDYASRAVEPCRCGRASPMLARIDGRRVDSIVRPDGRILHPYHLTLALEDVPHLAKFQIRQERHDYIRVLLVKDVVAEAADVSFAQDGELGKTIVERFSRILGPQVTVELNTVTDIPVRPGSHKYATVLSLVCTD